MPEVWDAGQAAEPLGLFFWGVGFLLFISSEDNSSENWLRVAVTPAVPGLGAYLAFFVVVLSTFCLLT